MRIILLSFMLFGCGCAGGKPVPNGTNEKLLHFHNIQRELKGRPAFTLDQYLCTYAQKHANWMADRSKLEHSDVSRLLGKFMTAGENIAWNQADEAQVVDAWMHSTGHRENILNRKFNRIGFGVGYNSKNQPYWCTCFGD